MSLLKQQRGLEGDSSAIVELNKDTLLEQVVLKSAGSFSILSVNVKAGTKTSDSGQTGLLCDGALNLSLQAIACHLNLMNEVFVADDIVDDLELKKAELISSE